MKFGKGKGVGKRATILKKRKKLGKEKKIRNIMRFIRNKRHLYQMASGCKSLKIPLSLLKYVNN